MNRPRLELQLHPYRLSAEHIDHINTLEGCLTITRGHTIPRRVCLPLKGKATVDLADELIESYGYGEQTMITLSDFPRMPEITVTTDNVASAFQELRKRARTLFLEGKLPRPKNAEQRQQDRIRSLERELDSIHDREIDILDELNLLRGAPGSVDTRRVFLANSH